MLPIQKIGDLEFLSAPCSNHENDPDFLSKENTIPVRHFHTSLDAYAPTPLAELSSLAEKLHVASILVKDESKRFGLNAFKGLGGSYALFRVVCEQLGLDHRSATLKDLCSDCNQEQVSQMVFVTATDGNHGKGVSWAAGLLGCEVHVYMPKGSVEARAQAIRAAGKAEVVITDLGYDDTVRYAAKMAQEHGWHLVQDTSWPGYETIPSWIIQGYTTMVYEALDQMREKGYARPTHVFLQAGVGAMAGGVLGTLRCTYKDQLPVVSIVEPKEVACIFESVHQNDGAEHKATGSEVTIMAGLNCAEPCQLTWPILRDFASYYFACPDAVSAHGMRVLAAPTGKDPVVISGESGAVTAGLICLLLEREEFASLRKELKIDETSVILLFNTEGDTDPEGYRNAVERGAYPYI